MSLPQMWILNDVQESRIFLTFSGWILQLWGQFGKERWKLLSCSTLEAQDKTKQKVSIWKSNLQGSSLLKRMVWGQRPCPTSKDDLQKRKKEIKKGDC